MFYVEIKVLFLAVIGVESVLGTGCPIGEICFQQKVICHLESWALSRSGNATFHLADIDKSLCTHLIYNFATLNRQSLQMEARSLGEEAWYAKVTALKSNGFKVLIGLGGWPDSKVSQLYSYMINVGIKRAEFVHGVVKFLLKHNFDGLDINWEYPKCWSGDCNLGPNYDKNNFANLVQELKIAFSYHKFILSASVSSYSKVIDNAYNVPILSKSLDWIGISSYSLLGPANKTNMMSPMSFVVDAIKYWKKLGAPAEKLVMGIPFYGHSFTLQHAEYHGVGAPADKGSAGPETNTPGLLAYFEFCSGWSYKNEFDMGGYAYNRNQWVSYNDPGTIQQKTQFILEQKLGGAMVWSVDMDDFTGDACGQGKYPLLSAIKNTLMVNGTDFDVRIGLKPKMGQNKTEQDTPYQILL